MGIELKWDGKETEVEKVSLPFQTVEKLTENRILKQERLDKWTEGVSWPEDYPRDWRNKLIWGDNKYIMSSLLRKGFAGDVDLIYVDPPFATGADFSMPIEVGDVETTKEPSKIEELAYRDTWGKGLQSYLQMMYKRLVLMHNLLSENGLLCIHLDWRVNHYVKTLLDEIFGRDRLVNEVVWHYFGFKRSTAKKFPEKHDTILIYSKGDNYTWNTQYKPHSDEYLERWKEDEDGRLYRDDVNPTGGGTRKIYLDEVEGDIVDSVWSDINPVNPMAKERMGFPTQKPESLLDRIISATTNEGDLVADFFCGSGTTGAVAEKLGRRWVISDLSKFAIHISRKRMLNLHEYSDDYSEPCRPFDIQNLGSYQKHKFIENEHPPVKEYRNFILELYEAEPLEGYHFIHGKKGNRAVHIAGVDSVVTSDEIEDAVNECANELGVNVLDVLGWDFELGLDKMTEDVEDMYGMEINLRYIPNDAAELRSISESDDQIKFFDLNYLETEYSVQGDEIHVEVVDFVLANPEYLEEDIRKTVDNFADWIDYWAIDFDYQDDIFHNMWQSFRTFHDRELETSAKHAYDSGGSKKIFVKVIDVFGNDTNEIVEVGI